jgi:hypothetical protein
MKRWNRIITLKRMLKGTRGKAGRGWYLRVLFRTRIGSGSSGRNMSGGSLLRYKS